MLHQSGVLHSSMTSTRLSVFRGALQRSLLVWEICRIQSDSTYCMLSLEKERLVADVVLLHRCMHGQSDYKLSDIGVALSTNNERSGKVRLEQKQHALCISSSLFPHRAVREWNAHPYDISTRPTLVVLIPNYIYICYLSDLLHIYMCIYLL